jgi:hypothetical protein
MDDGAIIEEVSYGVQSKTIAPTQNWIREDPIDYTTDSEDELWMD